MRPHSEIEMVLERHSGVAHEANARGVDSGEVRRPERIGNTTTKKSWDELGCDWVVGWVRIGSVFFCSATRCASGVLR